MDKKAKTILTLNELADSGILRWRNKATVRKYVEGYPEVFKQKIRGEGRSKRYVIERKNAEHFTELMAEGKLRGFKRVRGGGGVVEPFHAFVSIVSAGKQKEAGEVRAVAERLGYRTDLIHVHTRRELMGILGRTTRTHNVLILLINVREGRILMPDGTQIRASEIKALRNARGIWFKAILLRTNTAAKSLLAAFTKHGARFFNESVEGSRDYPSRWLTEMKEEGMADRSNPQHLIRKKSSLLGRQKNKSG